VHVPEKVACHAGEKKETEGTGGPILKIQEKWNEIKI